MSTDLGDIQMMTKVFFIKIFPGDLNIKLENEKQGHDMNLDSYEDPD